MGFVTNQPWRFVTNLADDFRSPQRLCSADRTEKTSRKPETAGVPEEEPR